MDDGVSGVTIQEGGDGMDSDLSGLIHLNHPYLTLLGRILPANTGELSDGYTHL